MFDSQEETRTALDPRKGHIDSPWGYVQQRGPMRFERLVDLPCTHSDGELEGR